MDLGVEIIRGVTRVEPLDYALLGRWIGHMRKGKFCHDSMAAAAPVPGEKTTGLLAHYGIGIGFAGLLLAVRPGCVNDQLCCLLSLPVSAPRPRRSSSCSPPSVWAWPPP